MIKTWVTFSVGPNQRVIERKYKGHMLFGYSRFQSDRMIKPVMHFKSLTFSPKIGEFPANFRYSLKSKLSKRMILNSVERMLRTSSQSSKYPTVGFRVGIYNKIILKNLQIMF